MSRKRFARDRHGRVVQAKMERILEQLTASEDGSLGILLLFSKALPKKDDGIKRNQIRAAYYFVCRKTEAQRSTLFTYTE